MFKLINCLQKERVSDCIGEPLPGITLYWYLYILSPTSSKEERSAVDSIVNSFSDNSSRIQPLASYSSSDSPTSANCSIKFS